MQQPIKPLPITAEQINKEIEAITERTNQKVLLANSLPEKVRSQIDISYLDDINYLLRYIMALHSLIEDVYLDKHGDKFDFDA